MHCGPVVVSEDEDIVVLLFIGGVSEDNNVESELLALLLKLESVEVVFVGNDVDVISPEIDDDDGFDVASLLLISLLELDGSFVLISC